MSFEIAIPDKGTVQELGKNRYILNKEVCEKLLADDIKAMNIDFNGSFQDLLQILWFVNQPIYEILTSDKDSSEMRNHLYYYLSKREMDILSADNHLHVLENSTIQQAISVCKNIFGPINEKQTGISSLEILVKLAQNKFEAPEDVVSPAFLMEFIMLFKALEGSSHIYQKNAVTDEIPAFLELHGREAAKKRMEVLDGIGDKQLSFINKFPSGLQDEVIAKREENKKRILDYFGAEDEQWDDYIWQTTHVIKTAEPILDLIDLSDEYKEAVKIAVDNKIPFGITPYYLSLMDKDQNATDDHAVRSMVLPPLDFVNAMVDHRSDRDMAFDFMGEHDTSPVDLVTRRYPRIAIVKPFNTCAQICVYCQRNWEIDECLDPHAMASKKTIDEAFSWLDDHPSVGDVLITGGDPLVMKDSQIERMLQICSEKDQVYRVRFGTRTPVVMPQRWTENLLEIIEKYHNPPKLEIAIVTHFEHPYEITPEALEAVQKIKKKGISVYNQEVFTIENSRRFESVKLRRDLKSIGIDPYYTFNMKGKGETKRYMVPIARLLQERKEEARLLPGLDRTDEPVFNVPRLGKNHLRGWQDHKLVMIKPDGSRIYEFHPWEKNISAVPSYNYTDVPLYDYLVELNKRGEDVLDYHTIWYYY